MEMGGGVGLGIGKSIDGSYTTAATSHFVTGNAR